MLQDGFQTLLGRYYLTTGANYVGLCSQEEDLPGLFVSCKPSHQWQLIKENDLDGFLCCFGCQIIAVILRPSILQ